MLSDFQRLRSFLQRGYKQRYRLKAIPRKGEERIYYQVSASILDTNTKEREFAPLRIIKDNYPKYVLSMDDLPLSEDGILQQNIIDFLLQ